MRAARTGARQVLIKEYPANGAALVMKELAMHEQRLLKAPIHL